jgi:hypothetical protein
MATFNVGDAVQAMYFDGGTVLGPGTVTGVVPRDDGGHDVSVAVEIAGQKVLRSYHVLKSGACDYLMTQAESDRLRALNPNFG